MKLPNADHAVVEEAKIRDYLLNPDHPFGADKARFFMAFGYSSETWERLAVALKEHAIENEIASMKETGFGPRYEINARIVAADGRFPRIRTVWQIDRGRTVPRRITAYPLEAEL